MYPPPPEHSAFDGPAFDKHTIETPEQVGLDFAVAGVGSRFLALLIDTLVQAALGVVLALLVGFGVKGLGASPTVWVMALAGLAVFLLLYGYFAIFEILWNGQTPGKWIIGIRVMKETGRPLTPAETIGRNLMRIVDQLPVMYAVGVVTMFLNSSNKRLGDLVAGSIVVRESAKNKEAPWLGTPAQGAGVTAFSPAGANTHAQQISIDDLRLIDTFLNRRREMTADVRSRMANQILGRLRSRIAIPDDGRPAEEIIEALARERRETYGG